MKLPPSLTLNGLSEFQITGDVATATDGSVVITAEENDTLHSIPGLINVGYLETGTWGADIIEPEFGGTGKNNGSNTISLTGGSISLTAPTDVSLTLPTSGTLATTSQLHTHNALTLVNNGQNIQLSVSTSASTALLNPMSLTCTWNSVLAGSLGGTAINNSGKSLTMGSSLIFQSLTGTNTQFLYNDNGTIKGSPNITTNGTTVSLSSPASISSTNTDVSLRVSVPWTSGNATLMGFYKNTISTPNLVGTIYTDGTGITLFTASDARLKKDVSHLDTGLDTVLQLNPANFKWISNDTPDIGFIAQELETVIPKSVITNVSSDYDENGEVISTTEMKMIDQTKIIPYLVSAVQDLKSQIDTLKADVLALQGV